MEKLLFYIKIRKKIAKISARNRNVDWLQVKIAEIKKINRELKTLEQLEEKNIDENNYSIQEEGWLGILFLVGTIFFSGLLLYGFIDGQADFSVIVAYGILIAFSGICTLHLFLWRVKVNHDVIEYRSFFGKKIL